MPLLSAIATLAPTLRGTARYPPPFPPPQGGRGEREKPVMAIFILVHGSWHGGWCWDSVAMLLAGSGHVVHAPDLPGLGGDPRDPPRNPLAGRRGPSLPPFPPA